MESIRILKSLYLVLAVLILTIGTIVFLEKKAPAENKSRVPATAKPTASTSTNSTSEIDTSDWKTYRNEEFGFEIRYPKEGELVSEGEGYGGEHLVNIQLPFPSGTLLRNKTFIIIAKKTTPEKCSNPLGVAPFNLRTEIVYISGIEFKRDIGADCGAGSCDESTSYSTTMGGNRCISLSLVLTVATRGTYTGGSPPDFDREKEIKVFDQILSTFRYTK